MNTSEIITTLDQIPISPALHDAFRDVYLDPQKKVVLSLAGDGAQAILGNIAILFFLHKLKIYPPKIEEIYGNSAGSMIGGLIASGLSLEKVIGLVTNLKRRNLLKFSMKKLIKNEGAYDVKKLSKYFIENLGVDTFEKCPIPFYSIATQIGDEYERKVVFHEGKLVDGIMASISIPYIFTPFEKDGNLYVDGVIQENTPCESIYEQHCLQNDSRELFIISDAFTEVHYNYQEIRGIFAKMLRLIGIFRFQLTKAQVEATRRRPRTHQLLINFRIREITRWDFDKIQHYIVGTYQQLIDKLEKSILIEDWWNKTI